MNKSEIVIVIAHYNNPTGLENSIKSIKEIFSVDLIIVDDGSCLRPNEDKIRDIYLLGNIYFEYLEENSGVGVAANLGLQKALEIGYKFIARLDCGDMFYPAKLGKQLTYLKANTDLKLLGTWAKVYDEKGNFLHNLKPPPAYESIKKRMFINSMFLNPSVVFYAEILNEVGLYDDEFKRAAQDYDFFFRVLKKFKGENLPEYLMDYIADPNSISSKSRRLQVLNRIKILLKNFRFGFYPIYGLIRSVILLLFTRNMTSWIKKKLNK